MFARHITIRTHAVKSRYDVGLLSVQNRVRLLVNPYVESTLPFLLVHARGSRVGVFQGGKIHRPRVEVATRSNTWQCRKRCQASPRRELSRKHPGKRRVVKPGRTASSGNGQETSRQSPSHGVSQIPWSRIPPRAIFGRVVTATKAALTVAVGPSMSVTACGHWSSWRRERSLTGTGNLRAAERPLMLSYEREIVRYASSRSSSSRVPG